MRIAGISVTKTTLFRGVQQEFSNVYHYRLATAVSIPWEELLDDVVAVERLLHSTAVNFTFGRVWRADGSQQENEMIGQKALTGTGTGSISTEMDRERAFLVMWPAGKSSTGKPVYLRKWYHSCGACSGYNPSGGILANTQEIPASNRQSIANTANTLFEVGNVDLWQLCAKSGRLASGFPTTHRFLEHHQLGDQWR